MWCGGTRRRIATLTPSQTRWRSSLTTRTRPSPSRSSCACSWMRTSSAGPSPGTSPPRCGPLLSCGAHLDYHVGLPQCKCAFLQLQKLKLHSCVRTRTISGPVEGCMPQALGSAFLRTMWHQKRPQIAAAHDTLAMMHAERLASISVLTARCSRGCA